MSKNQKRHRKAFVAGVTKAAAAIKNRLPLYSDDDHSVTIVEARRLIDGVVDDLIDDKNMPAPTVAALPAPSVAVKALDARAEAEALADRAGIDIGDDRDMFVDDLAKTLTRFAALSAQVQDAPLRVGRFGHHPEPAIDFCIEVEAMDFIVGGDQIAIAAAPAKQDEEWKDDPVRMTIEEGRIVHRHTNIMGSDKS